MTEGECPRWPIVVGVIVGAALLVVGTRSLLGAASDTHPSATITWVVGLAVAHDLLLVPVVLALGGILRRFAPRAVRPWLGAGLLISGAVGLVAWPLVRGYGRSAGNPSILPRNYGTGLALTLIAIWVFVILGGLADRFRQRHHPAVQLADSHSRSQAAQHDQDGADHH